MITIRVVHKLRLQEEGGRQSKNVNFYMVETVNEGKKVVKKDKNLSRQFLNDSLAPSISNLFSTSLVVILQMRPEKSSKIPTGNLSEKQLNSAIVCEVYYILTSVPTPRIKEFLLGNDTRLCIFPPFPCDVIRGLRWSPCPSDS